MLNRWMTFFLIWLLLRFVCCAGESNPLAIDVGKEEIRKRTYKKEEIVHFNASAITLYVVLANGTIVTADMDSGVITGVSPTNRKVQGTSEVYVKTHGRDAGGLIICDLERGTLCAYSSDGGIQNSLVLSNETPIVSHGYLDKHFFFGDRYGINLFCLDLNTGKRLQLVGDEDLVQHGQVLFASGKAYASFNFGHMQVSKINGRIIAKYPYTKYTTCEPADSPHVNNISKEHFVYFQSLADDQEMSTGCYIAIDRKGNTLWKTAVVPFGSLLAETRDGMLQVFRSGTGEALVKNLRENRVIGKITCKTPCEAIFSVDGKSLLVAPALQEKEVDKRLYLERAAREIGVYSLEPLEKRFLLELSKDDLSAKFTQPESGSENTVFENASSPVAPKADTTAEQGTTGN